MKKQLKADSSDLNAPPHAVGPAEVAQILGIGERQARQFIADGGVPSFRIGRRILVSKHALRTLLEGSSTSK
jgi:excisionase family DNA binding protein